MTAFTPEEKADLRLRAEQGSGFCLKEHTINQKPELGLVWITCGDVVLDRMKFIVNDNAQDRIRDWTLRTMGAHERAVMANVVLALLDEVAVRADAP